VIPKFSLKALMDSWNENVIELDKTLNYEGLRPVVARGSYRRFSIYV
jgi:hypothetical protein